ncbi:MAG: hypothetical protein U0176_04665 [Bacteroidia bacterium]
MKPAFRLLALLSMATLLTLSVVGCGDAAKKKEIPPEEMIAKSWKLQKLSLPGEQVDPAIMGTSSFTFYKNGRYEILMGELERGKWWLSPDKKILFTKADIRPEAGEMDIVKLEPDYLILTNNLPENPVTFEMVPVQ